MNKFLKFLFMLFFSFVLVNSALAIEHNKYLSFHSFLKNKIWWQLGSDFGNEEYNFYVDDKFLKFAEEGKVRYIIHEYSPWSITYKLLPPRPDLLTVYNYAKVAQTMDNTKPELITIYFLRTLDEEEFRRSIRPARIYLNATNGVQK